MNTQHLQYFVDACRLGSAFQSAALNNVARSTVSQGIKTLEDELGYKLTKKQRGTLEITKEGIVFANQAAQILKMVEELKHKTLSKDAQTVGIIKMATHQSFLNSYLWKRLRKFKKKFPKVDVQITTGIGAQISELLETQQIDLAITLDEIKTNNIRSVSSEILLNGDFKLVNAYKNKLTAEAPCIVTNIHKPEVSFLLRKAPWLKIESQMPSWTTIQKVVAKEPVFGYLPDYLLEDDDSSQSFREPRFAIPLRFPYQVRLWYQYRHRNNQLIQSLISATKE